ncbi:MAG TPA: enoyl-CoA hydratase/isomerase family protein [Pyrinomonadaceae bacterium]|jgi:enoyl-CoA hydratase|nr:enoyl-CoA hydratase/isomerase family protein [Pyrinomonadaceae bacterium]
MSFILEERRGAFTIIRLNRPEKLNSLSGEMILALSDLFKTSDADGNLRAIILTGTGDKAFCAGTDISELTELDSDRAREVSVRGQMLCNLIENCRVPVIAAVNGIAAGGGCELALACHLRIAATGAQFSLPETRLGVIPAYGGTQRLAREIGYGQALEMMLTGKTIGAEEALGFGLINHIALAGELIEQAEALALEIAALAPLAIRACLEAVVRGNELPIEEGLALETKLFASLFATDDVREGTSAFLEKRTPVFKGK